VGLDDQALSRAAIWYVGAFAALGSVLLAGASIASVDWRHAAHPWAALVLIGGAVVAAFTVVTLAALVINPGCTAATLRDREDKVQRLLQRQSGGKAVTWEDTAGRDEGVLRALYNDENNFGRSPNDLWAAAKGGDANSRAELASMVTVANGWLAYHRFRRLRYIASIAAAIILVGGVAWKPLTAPPAMSNPTWAAPVPVVVALAPSVSPGRLIGRGCSLRALDGVAIAGDLNSVVTVAFAPQGDCGAVVINVSPAEATVQRR
jgi:hypothetical protein